VFLCGTAEDDASVWHLFSKVVALVADVPTIRHRISTRINEFGQAPEELGIILALAASDPRIRDEAGLSFPGPGEAG
jgi:hypothetical protein